MLTVDVRVHLDISYTRTASSALQVRHAEAILHYLHFVVQSTTNQGWKNLGFLEKVFRFLGF